MVKARQLRPQARDGFVEVVNFDLLGDGSLWKITLYPLVANFIDGVLVITNHPRVRCVERQERRVKKRDTVACQVDERIVAEFLESMAEGGGA